MIHLRTLIPGLLLGLCSAWQLSCLSVEEESTEHSRRNQFLVEYNGNKKPNERLGALKHLAGAKDQYSIETLYSVSWLDNDPEVRSLAFSILTRCPDKLGYTAYLAADSFRREKEMGVKVEKAVAMGALRYKWAALNELTGFLRTLRWTYWNSWVRNSPGYIAAGIPRGDPGSDLQGNGIGSEEGSWHGGLEPFRYYSENELIAYVSETINRLSGTQMASRPRVDQEIVKWWEKRSDLWAEHDRKLRAKELSPPADLLFDKQIPLRKEEGKPGKDVLQKFLGADPEVNGDKRKEPVKLKPVEEEGPFIRNMD